MSFLILAVQRYQGSGEVDHKVVGEFLDPEKANEAIADQVETFHQREDGGGTWFVRVKEGDYVTKDGRYFVDLTQYMDEFPYPEGVKEVLEPY